MSAERIVLQCTFLADKDCKGYSPLYERLSRALATDEELIERLRFTPDAKRLPVNLFAATHWLIRQEPDSELAAIYDGGGGDPWPPFRDLVDARFEEIVGLLASRTIQTNEVGRCSALVPALATVSDAFAHRPISLIEIGPSAGLNLLVDRYEVTYDDGRSSGPPDSPVQLTCAVIGPNAPPLPGTQGLSIARREGIDLAPVDVRDGDACAWLEACIWPDVPGRLARFRAAVELARADPPTLHRGDALDLLGTVVDDVPRAVLPVVFTTWALAYFDTVGRQLVHDVLAERGRSRDLALVTAEYPRMTPWVAGAPRPPTDPDKGATLLSMTTWADGNETSRPLAWMHAHGQWIDWLEPQAAT